MIQGFSDSNNDTLAMLSAEQPLLWCNPGLQPLAALSGQRFSVADMQAAEARLERFAPLLVQLFPELAESDGLVESALLPAPRLQSECVPASQGALWIKADHALPVAGSIKARGGLYEVLCFAEQLALEQGLLANERDDYRKLGEPPARALFGRYTVAVGSTGNLGLSIGVMAAALGFQACVHMSTEAKEWKKERLRQRGVRVIEHATDYSQAVAAGRAEAAADPNAYFVDDESSERLFLGYSVAALRLQRQLAQAGVRVDAEHPLLVYLPCGVGGAPGGIAFGLKQLFGEAVHCFFAEPVQAPCVLVGMLEPDKRPLPSVYEVGLQVRTEADGLAVGAASELVCELMQPLLSGVFTVADAELFRWLYRLQQAEGLRIEPSAAAGFSGPRRLLESAAGQAYLRRQGLAGSLAQATHLVWTTGGSFVPEAEYRRCWLRGQQLAAASGAE